MSDGSTETRWIVESTGQISAQAVDGAVRISDWVTRHGHTLPIHPTQLYDSFGQILLFAGFLTLRRFRRFHGQVFFTWMMVYAIHRSTVELFRGDSERGTLHGLINAIPSDAWYNLSQGQLFSLIPFAAGAFFLFRGLRKVNAQPQVDLAALTTA
jgi:phosphatidylglycerol:prolipoprotein diacylglycerol transferase